MRKKLFSIVILMSALLMQTPVSAQNNNLRKADRKERVHIMSEQFINRETDYVAKQLQLEGNTKTEFTALYKKYATELRDSQKAWRNKFAHKNKEERKEMSDAEIEQRIEARFAHMQDILDIRKKYYGEFKKIMKPRQIQQMYKAEKDIQKKVRNEMGRRFNKKVNNKK